MVFTEWKFTKAVSCILPHKTSMHDALNLEEKKSPLIIKY